MYRGVVSKSLPKVGPYYLEQVDNIEYLGDNIEIKIRVRHEKNSEFRYGIENYERKTLHVLTEPDVRVRNVVHRARRRRKATKTFERQVLPKIRTKSKQRARKKKELGFRKLKKTVRKNQALEIIKAKRPEQRPVMFGEMTKEPCS